MSAPADCETCAGVGTVDAGGAAYDDLRLLLGLPESYELPCPDCDPASALAEILDAASNA